jgi:hypothetical protein
VTSELITNSLNYARSHGAPPKHVVPDIWLGVQVLDRYVHVQVRDPYPVPPVRRAPADTDTCGRGLLIVESLTACSWVETRTYDKTSHGILTKPGATLSATELDALRRP